MDGCKHGSNWDKRRRNMYVIGLGYIKNCVLLENNVYVYQVRPKV